MAEFVVTEIDEGVATIRINNPAKRNCLDVAGAAQLAQSCAEAAERDSVSVIVLRGSGGQAFSAGADLRAIVDADDLGRAALDMAAAIDHVTDAIAAIPVPVIAGIEGACLGGGLQIAAACDVRIASESAVVGIPAIQRGFIASPKAVARLSRLTGVGAIKLLLLEGRGWSSAEAQAKGLVDIVVPDEDFARTLTQFAKSMATLDREAIAASKRVVDALSPLDEAALADLQTLHDRVNSREKIRAMLAAFSRRRH